MRVVPDQRISGMVTYIIRWPRFWWDAYCCGPFLLLSDCCRPGCARLLVSFAGRLAGRGAGHRDWGLWKGSVVSWVCRRRSARRFVLDLQALQRGFAAWAASTRGAAREAIPLGVKTLRRLEDVVGRDGRAPPRPGSCWRSERRALRTDKKSGAARCPLFPINPPAQVRWGPSAAQGCVNGVPAS
jgi:hypothetical protein